MRTLAVATAAAALVTLLADPASAAPGNTPPTAVDDAVSYRNTGGIDHLVPALANDTDPDGDPLTVTAVTAAAKGTAYVQDGKLYYEPLLAETGTDSFTYTVSDGQGGTSTATVTATLWVDPAAPGNPTITIPTPGSATLTWSAADRAVEYRLYRDGQLVHSTPGLSWTTTGLADSGSYTWSVVAVNGGGFLGPWAANLNRAPKLPTPQATFVAGTDDPTSVVVTWDMGGMFGPWRVYRDGTPVGTVSQCCSFEDTGLVPGQEYGYQVQLIGTTTATTVWPPSSLSAVAQGTPGVLSPIGQLVQDLGGPSGVLGPVTQAEHAIPGGRRQNHQFGAVLQQDGEAPVSVVHPVFGVYASSAAHGADGDVGFPITEQETGLRDGGVGQLFENGSIWVSSSTPGRVVWTEIEEGWAVTGWEEGPHGYPVGAQVALRGGVGQAFEDGAVYWTPTTGSHGVSGPIWDSWSARGWENGPLGYPTSDEVALSGGVGQVFTGGTMYWSPATGAHAVGGAIRGEWAARGWENGPLGYPTTDEIPLRGGVGQVFTGGTMYWSPATGAHPVGGAIRDAWARLGWENGRMGYPTTGENCGLRGGGCWQGFQGGTVHWSPVSGAHATFGAIREAWGRQGWENGRLGYPTSGEVCGLRGGGCGQAFQGGTIHWSPATGAQITTGAIRDAWARQGWETGRLGYPTTGENCGLRGGGCWQGFQGGTIHWSPTTGAHATSGAIRDAWGREGWENGRLGYPNAGEFVSGGAMRQTFQGGSISVDLRTGRVTVTARSLPR